MSFPKKLLSFALAVVVGTPLMITGAAASPAPSTGSPHTVTLITGDKVSLFPLPGGKQGYTVTPAPNRKEVDFSYEIAGEELNVIPSDAAPLVAEGRLDARLFNVTKLVEQRYDDASASELPLIITGAGVQAWTGP